MGYLGRNPAIGTQKVLDSLESQFNGTLTTFDLRYNGTPTYPTLSESLIVSLGGVLQEPGEAYYVSSDTIVFAGAPPAGSDCWILLYSEYGAAASAVPSQAIQATGEPNGIETKSHSVISFDNGTRVFTIAPNTAAGHTQYVVWTKAVRRVYSVSQSVTIPPTTGLYYIYFSNTGVLSYRTNYFDWENDAMVAYVYWNATTSSAPFVADERHGITLDWATHEYLHRTRGAVIAEGFSISNYTTTGDGSADADAQFDLANGTFFDEDLEVGITHSATPSAGTFTQVLTGNAEIPVFYMSGSEGDWVKDAATEFACKQSGTTLQYNSLSGGTWSTTPAGNNLYVVSWVVATNEINAPVICVLGQDQYSNIGAAEATSFSSLDLTNFPAVEFRPLWKIIFRTSSGYANTPNAYIAGVTNLRQLTGPSGGGELVSDHGGLTGLADDDHSQYVHISTPRTISAAHNFTAGADFTGGMVSLSGGAILANLQTISGGGTTTIPPGYNANSFGPVVTIANGTEVIVSSPSFWVIRD